MIELINKKDIISDRKNWLYRLVKFFSLWGYKNLTTVHLEMHDDLKHLKQENAVFLYAGLHKSLWEITGILVALSLEKLPVPYGGMGDNLIKGKYFQKLTKKAGVFWVKRPSKQVGFLESAKLLKQQMVTIFAYGKDVILFPEGTRKKILEQGEYGKFFPTAFDAVLEYEKKKEELIDRYDNLSLYDTYIVPVNVDYSRIREDWDMIRSYKGEPRTLHILDSLKMLENIGDTYVNFGKPIPVKDHLDKDRKSLAILTREKCLELVRILPINVVSRAVVDSIEGKYINAAEIECNIARVIDKLCAVKDWFRGFSSHDNPRHILKKVAEYERSFRPGYFDMKNLPFYKMHADYIGHYFTNRV